MTRSIFRWAAEPPRLRPRGLVGLVGLSFFLLGAVFAGESEAGVSDYHLVVTPGVEVPGYGVTDLEPTVMADPDGVALLQRAPGREEAIVTWDHGGTPGAERLVTAIAASPYGEDTLIAPRARAHLNVRGSASWRLSLYDFNAADGSMSLVGEGWILGSRGADSVEMVLDNSAYTVAAGHRLAAVVEAGVLPRHGFVGPEVSLVVGGSGPEGSYVVVDEVPEDSASPSTLLSTSPPRPDGTHEWFTTAPQITLTASSPVDSMTTIHYAWDDDPPALYTGTFTAPSGRHVLRYYAEDQHGHAEPERTVLFRVDANLAKPELELEGSGASGKLASGAVPLELTARDEGSRLAEVAIYAFPKEGEGWAVAGHLIGGETTALPGGDGYRVIWNTATTPDGEYLLQAQSRDNAGNVSWSESTIIVVDNSPPEVELEAPLQGAEVTLPYAVIGSVADRSELTWAIEVRRPDDGRWSPLKSGDRPVRGPLGVLNGQDNPFSRGPGLYELRVMAKDSAGNRTEGVPVPFHLKEAPAS